MEKTATLCHPVLEVIRKRWSPRAFQDRAVPTEALRSLFEAARWAASCFNEQPWRYLVATKDEPDEFQKILGCLAEKNQRWAGGAPVLMVAVGKKTFTQNGKPDPTWQHDVGLADAQMMLEAVGLGLAMHGMAGFDKEKVRKAFSIPLDFEPVAVFALGYPGDPSLLPEEFRAAETAPRKRRDLHEFVFSELWEEPAALTLKTVGDTP